MTIDDMFGFICVPVSREDGDWLRPCVERLYVVPFICGWEIDFVSRPKLKAIGRRVSPLTFRATAGLHA